MDAHFEHDDIGEQQSSNDWLPDVLVSTFRALAFLVIPLCVMAWQAGAHGLGPTWLEMVGRSALITTVTVVTAGMAWGMVLYQTGSKTASPLFFCSPVILPVSIALLIGWVYVLHNFAITVFETVSRF